MSYTFDNSLSSGTEPTARSILVGTSTSASGQAHDDDDNVRGQSTSQTPISCARGPAATRIFSYYFLYIFFIFSFISLGESMRQRYDIIVLRTTDSQVV